MSGPLENAWAKRRAEGAMTIKPGDRVEITAGPFQTYDALVEAVNEQQQIAQVWPMVFRRTPVWIKLAWLKPKPSTQ